MPYPFIPKPSQFGRQFNIMALVGNGFDIQVMSEYAQTTTTRYPDFYHFMKMKNVDASNLVLNEMEQALHDGKLNWSDIEACITSLATRRVPVSEIRSSLDEVRSCFSEFLNSVVSAPLLSRLSEDSQMNKWASRSASGFLADIANADDLRKIPFGMRKANYDLYNYYFVNFNYTSMLDDYIHMDPVQFDPVPHSTVDTNFWFNTDPKRLSGDTWNFNSSSYVETQVVHPHGYQDIPRSILFGTNGDGNPRSDAAKLAKTYWARVDQRYGHLFADTDLFIVFGCSLGATDSWWWEHIAESLAAAGANKRALLLYWWNGPSATKLTSEEVLNLFFAGANVAEEDRVALTEKICVISYNDDDERVWLNTSRDKES